MFRLEYPGRAKPHELQDRQKRHNDDKAMTGRLEQFNKIDRLLPLQHFQNRVHPLPNCQVVRQDLHELFAGIAIQDPLQRIHEIEQADIIQQRLVRFSFDRRALLTTVDLPPQPLMLIQLIGGLFELFVLE